MPVYLFSAILIDPNTKFTMLALAKNQMLIRLYLITTCCDRASHTYNTLMSHLQHLVTPMTLCHTYSNAVVATDAQTRLSASYDRFNLLRNLNNTKN